MSRRPRHRNRDSRPAPTAATPGGSAGVHPFNLSGFEAANPSQRRGWIPWTTLDSAKVLTGGDRKTILRNANWAYANIGLARRIVNGLANLVGYLTPQAQTDDGDWNSEAEALFRSRAGSASVFDRAGKLDFFSWQIANTRARLKDGDILTVLTETDAGTARVIVYEANRIDDGSPLERRDDVRDGVYVDKFGRHTAYRVVDPEDPKKYTAIPASDAIFFADFERPGQVRGISALAHALIHLQDRAEVWGDIKHAIKVAAQVGMQKVKDLPGPYPGQNFTPPEPLSTGATDSAGNDIKQNTEKILGSGYVVPMQPGEKYELLHDDRPHPNQREFLEDLVRDIAWGVGVAPEVLWQLAGQTGPNTRYLMAELQRYLAQEQTRLAVICQRFWVYFIAKEINAGRLRIPADEMWWKCDWIPQPDLTIDRGREGNLQLEQLRHGAITFDDIYRSNGADFESSITIQIKRLESAREKAEAAGFTLEQVMPGFFNKPAAPAADPQKKPDPNQPNESQM